MAFVRINLTGHGRGEVYVDGMRIPKVLRVEVSAEAGENNRVTFTMAAEKVEVTGVAEVTTVKRTEEVQP